MKDLDLIFINFGLEMVKSCRIFFVEFFWSLPLTVDGSRSRSPSATVDNGGVSRGNQPRFFVFLLLSEHGKRISMAGP